MGYTLGLMILPLALGFVALLIARSVTEADARVVGYMYAFLFFVTAVAALLSGISGFAVYASRLRQAEAD